jgi:hypothetical protein
VLKPGLIVLGLLIAFPYARGPLYRFPEPVPFAGPAFLNPYEGLQGVWQRANLHAHGRAWGGLTNGRQPSEEIVRAYSALGYSVPGVSNYHQIAAHDGVPSIPLYEHGYNITKTHQIVIGADRVDWFDFPLWQARSHQQFVIDRLAVTGDLIALAHPPSRRAYSPDDLRWLTGYQLLEVINGPHRSEAPWDAALSSGRVVWALANDDSHDLHNADRTGVAWNMIAAASPSTTDVVEALRAGRAYAVLRTGASGPETRLASFRVDAGTITVSCEGEPSSFLFVGQNGEVRRTVDHARRAEYTFTPDDTYIRTVIRAPHNWMYLNPVVRYDGQRVPAPAAVVDSVGTTLMRASVALAALAALVIYGYWRRRLSPSVTVTPPLLRDAKHKTA